MLGHHGADVPRKVGFWSIVSSGLLMIILRDRCRTSYDLTPLCRGSRSTLHRWSGQIAKRIGTRPSALNSTFVFEGKSCRSAPFLMLSTSKLEKFRRLALFASLQIYREIDRQLQLQVQLHLLQLQLQLTALHYTTLQYAYFTTLHYNYNYN